MPKNDALEGNGDLEVQLFRHLYYSDRLGAHVGLAARKHLIFRRQGKRSAPAWELNEERQDF